MQPPSRFSPAALIASALISGLLSGFAAWPSVVYMGLLWPVIPSFLLIVGLIWRYRGRRDAVIFTLVHLAGCIGGLLLLWAYIVLRYR